MWNPTTFITTHTVPRKKPVTTEETIWYDEAFRVRETRFGLFVSVKKDGKEVITAPTLESCIEVTRFHLKGEQEGFPELESAYASSAAVDL